MLLKSLEIQGFKTFPDKTKLTFDKGITSIVGPNGSGKSNISDAVRWVLGEQSAKALRCAKMEDVIFKGTDSRKRTSYAEVTLTIKNDDRALPFDSDEVAVTRRFYRSGESEYLINKTAVRLKDINELFMDTGLGRDGYSMISQGKIDSIVATKSEDRREIFEEAAGISRFRYRKTEAEKQLQLTEENLIRLRDILSELESRIGPLSVQSEKAQKFLLYSKEKRGLEITVWLDTLNKSAQFIREQDERISVSRAQLDNLENELNNINERGEEIYKLISDKTILADENRQSVYRIGEEISALRSSISVYQNDIRHNKDTIIRINTEIEGIMKGFEKSEETQKIRRSTLEEKNKSLTEKKNKYSLLIEKINDYNENALIYGGKIQELTKKNTDLNKSLADAKMRFMSGNTASEEINARISSISELKQKYQTGFENSKAEADELKILYEDYLSQKAELEKLLNETRLKLQNEQKKSDVLRDEINRLFLDSNERLRRIKLLEDLEKNMDGYFHSVKSVMKEAENGGLEGILGPVSRLINVAPEYGTAIETALGAAMQYIVTETEADAKKAIAFLKKTSGGRATFLPITNIKPSNFFEKGLEKHGGFVAMADKLCKYDGKYTAVISSLLGKIAVCTDIDSAAALSRAYGYKFKTVTLDGQVVNAGGSLTGGSISKSAGFFTRAAEIQKNREIYNGLCKELENSKHIHKEAETEVFKTKSDLSEKEADYTNIKELIIKIQAEIKSKNLENNNLASTLKTYDNEINSCRLKLSQLESAGNILKEQIDRLIKDIEITENQIDAVSGNKDEIFLKKDKLNSEIENCHLQIVLLEKETEALNSEIANTELSEKYQTERKKSLEKELFDLIAQNSEKEKSIDENLTLISESEKSLTKLSSEVEVLIAERTALEKESGGLRQTEKEKSSEKNILVAELAKLEERKVNLQKKYDDIISKLWEDYELTRREAEKEAVHISSISDASKRLNELKSKIKALGSVNVSAIEEYKEVSERYKFMKNQVNDIESSKKEILSLINQLTSQMSELFLLKFNEISENFSKTFSELFGGGKAHLELSDPSDILNTGIEIYCNPPGKIVEHLEALSGGEKALVAIALYFAIMKVRPAPFCVMDEIEAALDEVNVYRFAAYMRRINDKTQFILITHRRGTMEEADVLYGVTMQDKGISKLLELKANEVAEKLKMEV